MRCSVVIVAASAFLTAVPANASTPTIGDKGCSDAEVVASIEKQTPERIAGADFVLLRVEIDVQRVVHGTIPSGRNEISVFSPPEELNPDFERWHMFLKWDRHGHWTIAECPVTAPSVK